MRLKIKRYADLLDSVHTGLLYSTYLLDRQLQTHASSYSCISWPWYCEMKATFIWSCLAILVLGGPIIDEEVNTSLVKRQGIVDTPGVCQNRHSAVQDAERLGCKQYSIECNLSQCACRWGCYEKWWSLGRNGGTHFTFKEGRCGRRQDQGRSVRISLPKSVQLSYT